MKLEYAGVNFEQSYGERELLMYALTGSWNYNLNDETSDKDFKLFVCPLFNDLYNGNECNHSFRSPVVDYTTHDIRKVSRLFWKANISFLEILYSKELVIASPILQHFLLTNRSGLVTMNLPYLYNSCIGMHHEKANHLLKGTETTQVLVDKFGYDTKQALHAYRVLDFLKRFCYNEFTDFEEALHYSNGDAERAFMFEIKQGRYSLETMKDVLSMKLQETEQFCRERYLAKSPNEELRDALDETVKQVVKLYML